MAWNDTKEGSEVENAWWQLRLLFNQRLPNHRQRLHDLSNRGFRG